MASWIDWILPYRFLIAYRNRVTIKEQVSKMLPPPFDPLGLTIDKRLKLSIEESLSSDNSSGLPEKTDQGWNDKLETMVFDRRALTIAGLEAAGLYSIGLLENFATIDEHIYESMSHLSGQQISNLGDLTAKIEGYQHSAWSGLSEGTLNKVDGSLGEVVAADHLSQAGLSVAWPDASNQQAWDLLVQGHEVNVKTVADASSLTEHFAKFPDVPAIVPGDMHNIPEGAIHFDPTHGVDQLWNALVSHKEHIVIVDDALSHADVIQHAEHATDAALGSADVVHAHFPFITFAFSGWREIKLLAQAKTDIGTSLKNTTSDVVGTGGGALIGAKAGALAGSVFGPAGTFFGAVVGSIAGAVGGRKLSNEFKRVPLNEELNKYEKAQQNFNQLVVEEERHVEQSFTEAQNEQQTRLSEAVSLEKHQLITMGCHMKIWRKQSQFLPTAEATAILDDAQSEIRIILEHLQMKRKSKSFWIRYFWPDTEVLALNIAIAKMARADCTLSREISATGQVDRYERSRIFNALGNAGAAKLQVEKLICETEEERVTREVAFRKTIENARSKIADMRIVAFQRLSEILTRLKDEVRAKLAPIIQELSKQAEKVKIEARKLGLA